MPSLKMIAVVCTIGLSSLSGWAQSSAPTSTPANSNANGQVVRNPVDGRLYYQQWVTESVPVVRWENKQITTTIYENQWVPQTVPTTRTIYQPQTQYVLQPQWQGVWNPFRQPTLAYQFKPVTTWKPTTATSQQVVMQQQMVPRQQTITIPQPITETKTQQRLVQTEIPQSNTSQLAAIRQPQVGYTASQQPALFRIPLLARQSYFGTPTNNAASAPVLAVPSLPSTQPSTSMYATHTNPAPASASPAIATNALRPVTRAIQSVMPPASYAAPLKTASGQGGTWNAMQSGMSPTVLR